MLVSATPNTDPHTLTLTPTPTPTLTLTLTRTRTPNLEQALAAHESLAPPTSTSFKIALHDPALVQRLLRLPAHGFKAVEWHGSMVKVAPRQCPSSAPVPPQGAPGGSGQLGTPGKRPAHWVPATASGARASCLRSRQFPRL